MGYSGRDLRISRDGTPIAGARSDDFTLNGEPVDITDKDSLGWRTLLPGFGVRSASGSVAGIMKDGALAGDILAGDAPMESHTIAVGDIAILNGDFKLVSYAPTGAHDGAAVLHAALSIAVGHFFSNTTVNSIANNFYFSTGNSYTNSPDLITGTWIYRNNR
jgi:predicted secreted protein